MLPGSCAKALNLMNDTSERHVTQGKICKAGLGDSTTHWQKTTIFQDQFKHKVVGCKHTLQFHASFPPHTCRRKAGSAPVSVLSDQLAPVSEIIMGPQTNMSKRDTGSNRIGALKGWLMDIP